MNQDLSGLDLLELTALMEPVPEPPPVSLWPQTVGWLWLAGLIFLLLTWLGWRRWQAYKARAYRREALAALQAGSGSAAEISGLLRRVALVAYPRSQVASQHGQSWLEFMDKHYPGNGFSQGAGQALCTDPYRRQPARPNPALQALAVEWIRTHVPVQERSVKEPGHD